ncbi:hypothetical protein ACOMHN_028197 [Nucella lapillus]
MSKEVRQNAGHIFNISLQFQSDVTSDIDCLRQCVLTSSCVAFTFNPLAGTCRGHAAVMTSGDLQALETKYYERVLDWLNRPCSSNSQCSTTSKAECYAGKCMCTPGYFYSDSKKTCSTECAAADLQSSMLSYTGMDWAGFDNMRYYRVPLSMPECQSLCASLSACRAAVHVNSMPPGHCYVKANNKTCLDRPDRIRFDQTGKSYMQRTCA